MASLKCSKCGYGIHYHDEPNGVEWIAFEMETWNRLCSSRMPISSYELDTKSGWYTVWKCEKCGTLHVFKAMDIYIDMIFESQDAVIGQTFEGNVIECVAFEDVVWDQITETEEEGNAFDDKFKDVPRKYIRFCKDTLYIYTYSDCTSIEKMYKLLDKQVS